MSRHFRRRTADPIAFAAQLFPALFTRRSPGLFFLWPVIALGACLLAGCGTQGPPQPPRVERPEQITDLTALQVGRTLEIRFTLPQRASDGERLTKPLELELLRSVTTPGSQLPPPAAELTPWVRLTADQWSADAHGDAIIFPARLSEQEFSQWQEKTLVLAVRTLTRGFRHRALESDFSNLIQIPLLNVSGPVANLEAPSTEQAIELRWTAPLESVSGGPLRDLAGYRIYRSLSGQAGSFQPLGEASSPLYLDRNFEWGHTYFYKVRAVFKEAGGTAESEDSLTAKVTPRDVFPPAAPTGLTAVYTAGTVELIWNASSERDLAGYDVYRHEEKEPARKVNAELLRTPILHDTTAQPEHIYSYWVTAMDLAGNESPPSTEVTVEVK